MEKVNKTLYERYVEAMKNREPAVAILYWRNGKKYRRTFRGEEEIERMEFE